MPITLTDRQRLCLAVIESSIRTRGYPPTLREIGNAMSIASTKGVYDHLRVLERKGYIKREATKSRGITVLQGTSVTAAIEYAQSDACWLTDIVIACVNAGWSGPTESLPKWLAGRLSARTEVGNAS